MEDTENQTTTATTACDVIHHQTIIVATVKRKSNEISCEDLRVFLRELVAAIGMQALFDPIPIHGKFGFTGIVGIVTSHIAFHFFDADQSLHFDVYSCKEYDLPVLIDFIDQYWKIETANILFIKRDEGPSIERFSYQHHKLKKQTQI